MNFGLSKRATDIVRGVLNNYPEVQRAVIYGSRAKGNFREGSDIDLTLFGSEITHQVRSRIWNDLDDSSLPYFIDLSVFESISNDALRDHINRVGKVFYEKITDAATTNQTT